MYLEGFIGKDAKIWTYDKSQEEIKVWLSSIDDVAIKKFLYSLDSSIQDINLIEDYFAIEIEGPATEALKKLRVSGKIGDNKKILTLFFAFLMVRTPSYLQHIESLLNKLLNLRFFAAKSRLK
jgi:hypothetical protein